MTEIKHGVDGWGLEWYSREEDVKQVDPKHVEITIFGSYEYERVVAGKTEVAKLVRILSHRRVPGVGGRGEAFED